MGELAGRDSWVTPAEPEELQGALAGVELEACVLGGWSEASEMGRIDLGATILDLARFGPSVLF